MIGLILDEFHFASLWNGGILLFVLFGAIIYLFILPAGKEHSIWKAILFFIGSIALFVSVGSPLNIVGRIQYSSHIIQILLLLFIAPPLMIYGLKRKWFDHVIATYPAVKKTVYALTHPVFAMVIFYILFYGYHIPAIFNFARVDLYINYFYLLVLFIAAILLWVPIFSKHRLTKKQKMLYSLINMILLLPYGFVLLLANGNLYTVYTDLSSFISALEVCLPVEKSLPKTYYEALLPFAPVDEQVKGGKILIVGVIAIFSLMMGLVRFVKSKPNTSKEDV
ncbi:MAG TPA: cytochrome c oxidase assembly protein [Bacillota bacterium]|nr:cytochrome c oxidase assembly protein [Bacillota bacterium]